MNLHGIVTPAISLVNPQRKVTINRSTGQMRTLPDGTRLPGYTSITVMAQIQDLTGEELRQLEGLNIQGAMKNIYINGNFDEISRVTQVGGDVFLFDNQEWLVVRVAEAWPDWCKVVVRLQVPRPTVTPFYIHKGGKED